MLVKKFLLWSLLCMYTIRLHAADENSGLLRDAARDAAVRPRTDLETYEGHKQTYKDNVKLYQSREMGLFRVVKVIISNVEKMKRSNIRFAYEVALSELSRFIHDFRKHEKEQGVTESVLTDLYADYEKKMEDLRSGCKPIIDNQMSEGQFDALVQMLKGQNELEINEKVIDVVRADILKKNSTHTVGVSLNCYVLEPAPFCGCGVGKERRPFGKAYPILQCLVGPEDLNGSEGGYGLSLSVFSAKIGSRNSEKPKRYNEGFLCLRRSIDTGSLKYRSYGIGPAFACSAPDDHWYRMTEESQCLCHCGGSIGYDVPWILTRLGIGAPERPVKPTL